MRKDPTEFRKRFAKWKETGEYELPRFGDGEEGVDWKRWDDAQLTSYDIPFIKEKKVKLTNAGRATGAVLSTNLLDSIADNADRAGLPLETALGIAVKESTLGNPTDDRSAWKLSSGIRKQFNDVYPGTSQYINPGRSLNAREDVINYHKGHQSDDPNSKGKSVLQEAFEFYGKHPDKYNTGQKGYQDAVNKRGSEIMQSPEIQTWKAIRDSKKAYQNSRWVRPNPALNKSRFNLPTFEGGEEEFKPKKIPEFVQAGKDNSWSKVTNNNMGEVFQSVVARPNRTGGNTSAGSWKKQWEPKYEKPLEIVSPEFDVMTAVRGITGVLPKKATTITAKNATKITPEQWDAAYMTAISDGNAKEIQRLRDLHFKSAAPNSKMLDKNGMPLKQYHTVADAYPAGFNEFNPAIEGTHSAIYTSDSPIMSGTYSNKIISDAEREYYIDAGIENMKQQLSDGYIGGEYKRELEKALKSNESARQYVIDRIKWLKLPTMADRQKVLYANVKKPLVVEGAGRHWNNIPISSLPKNVYKALKSSQMNGYSTRDIELAQKIAGNYDGAIIKNITDYGGSWKTTMHTMKPSTVYQINDPRNLKYADPITYDDAGKIIPLSQRDNFNIADLRYGIVPTLIGTSAYQMYK